MNITIIAVGKLKEKFWKDACHEYLKRLKSYSKVNIIEIPDIDPAKAGNEHFAKAQEGQNIIKHIPQNSYVIALCIDGHQKSSPELSKTIQHLTLHGHSHITFIIGGSTGLDNQVLQQASEKLSFGKITLPHNLARVVLLEQIYRGFKIARNETYHK